MVCVNGNEGVRDACVFVVDQLIMLIFVVVCVEKVRFVCMW